MSHTLAVLVLIQHSGKRVAGLENRLTYLEAVLGQSGLFLNESLSTDTTIAQNEQNLDRAVEFGPSSAKAPPVRAEKALEVTTDHQGEVLSQPNLTHFIASRAIRMR